MEISITLMISLKDTGLLLAAQTVQHNQTYTAVYIQQTRLH